jgi:hypothetical protein
MDVRLARNPDSCYNSTSLPDSHTVRWVRRLSMVAPLGGVVLLFIWQRPLYHTLKPLSSYPIWRLPVSLFSGSRPIPLAVFANKTRHIVILNQNLQSQPVIRDV